MKRPFLEWLGLTITALLRCGANHAMRRKTD
jgi:hypothetical protein